MDKIPIEKMASMKTSTLLSAALVTFSAVYVGFWQSKRDEFPFKPLQTVTTFPDDPQTVDKLFRAVNPVKFTASPCQQWRALESWSNKSSLLANLCPKLPTFTDVCSCDAIDVGGLRPLSFTGPCVAILVTFPCLIQFATCIITI